MKDLEQVIISIQSKKGHEVNVKVRVLFACLDLPARALAQNRVVKFHETFITFQNFQSFKENVGKIQNN